MHKPPLITETAFSCPHCGAFARQQWFKVFADALSEDNTPPHFMTENEVHVALDEGLFEKETADELLEYARQLASGDVFFETGGVRSGGTRVDNLHLSECFNCDRIAIWVHKHLLFPSAKHGALPNPDLPADIARDYEEARSIVDQSPRGAAALLRLAIQKLCVELGEKGKKIDDDIKNLVSKGLDPMIQQALDTVRVIGNQAVHPGELDLRDDRETAICMFDLINMIAERMISHPKKVQAVYSKLPQRALDGIVRRDAAVTASTFPSAGTTQP